MTTDSRMPDRVTIYPDPGDDLTRLTVADHENGRDKIVTAAARMPGRRLPVAVAITVHPYMTRNLADMLTKPNMYLGPQPDTAPRQIDTYSVRELLQEVERRAAKHCHYPMRALMHELLTNDDSHFLSKKA